jgi:hypothetical protein
MQGWTFRSQGQSRRAFLTRLLVVSALVSSVFAASSPCAGMGDTSSTHNCCKKRGSVTIRERCHTQSISSCCAERPQSVAVVSTVTWSDSGLAPQATIHQWSSFDITFDIAIPDTHPASYLQHFILRI